MSLWLLLLGWYIVEISCLMLDGFVEDGMSFEGDDDCFMSDISGTFSGVPACPMEVDIELVLCNESREEIQIFSFCVGPDKDDPIASSKGVYGRSGKSTTGEVGVIRHGISVAVMESVVGAIVLPAEAAVLKCVNVGNVYAGSRFEVVVLVSTPDGRISKEALCYSSFDLSSIYKVISDLSQCIR